MLGWAVALVALEVGGVVWAVNVVSGLECMSANCSTVSFFSRDITYTTPGLWKVIHDFNF
jgi:hypothetical protein